jgi:hypothetical protein
LCHLQEADEAWSEFIRTEEVAKERALLKAAKNNKNVQPNPEMPGTSAATANNLDAFAATADNLGTSGQSVMDIFGLSAMDTSEPYTMTTNVPGMLNLPRISTEDFSGSSSVRSAQPTTAIALGSSMTDSANASNPTSVSAQSNTPVPSSNPTAISNTAVNPAHPELSSEEMTMVLEENPDLLRALTDNL